MRQVALVVNPSAGHGRARRVTPDVEARLAAGGLRVTTRHATSAEHALQACEDAVASGVDGLVARHLAKDWPLDKLDPVLRALLRAAAFARVVAAGRAGAQGSSHDETVRMLTLSEQLESAGHLEMRHALD